MRKTTLYGTLAITLLVGAVACDQAEDDTAGASSAEQTTEQAAEQGAVPGQQSMDPEMMARVMEIQEIQGKLEPIQMQALEDEELASRLAELQARIEAAMRAEDEELMNRMGTLQEDMAAAQQAGDQQRMQELMVEAQGLQGQMQALQREVLERPEIREDLEAFEADHRARMIEIDPEAGAMLDRMDELVEELGA